MPKIKIFVMTHTIFTPPKETMYEPLHVGRALGQELGYTGDDSGDNISELNPLFGELTGFYWLWKNLPYISWEDEEDANAKENEKLQNDDLEYIGICHYRRYFEGKDGFLTEDEALQLMSEYDMVTSQRSLSAKKTYDTYAEIHHAKDMDATIASLHKLYPEYDEAARVVLEGRENCFGNLMILPVGEFMQYSEWLFNILLDAASSIDPSSYDAYHKRVYGFLAEVLENIWVRYHERSCGWKILPQKILYTQEKSETVALKLSVAELLQQNKPEEARDLYEKFLELRPDVAYPAADLLGETPIIRHLLYIIVTDRAAGVSGIYDETKDLGELVRLYRDTYDKLQILSLEEDSEDVESALYFLKEHMISEAMIEVMLRNDLSQLFHREALRPERIRRRLEM